MVKYNFCIIFFIIYSMVFEPQKNMELLLMKLKVLDEIIDRLEAHQVISSGIDNGIEAQIERLKSRKSDLLQEIEDYKKLHGDEGKT
jgi:hypothetical protein